MATRPKSTKTKFGAERARQHIQTRFNPIRGLTPSRLSRDLDSFSAGHLRNAAILWQKILERDDQVITAAGKRRRKVAGLNWEILPANDSPEATRHKEALEAFYANLTAVNALDENQRGGIGMLIEHMHSAVGMRYAAHEIVWQPGGFDGLTAEFRFIPLQFLENTTGRLRFLPSDFAPYGEDLDEFFGEGGWMVTAGEGLMEATSVAYMFKSMPLKAWVGYTEKFGTPPLHAKTGATIGSEEWEALKTALTTFGEDLALVTNLDAEITAIEIKNAGTSPHPALVDRMDRAISRIWLGGDLATMSAGNESVGSQPQSDGLEDLVESDCAMINNALRHYVDRWVIRYRLGVERPLAYFELQPPAEIDVEREIRTDEFLIGSGVPRGKKDLLERYGRPEPDAGDELATAPAAAPSPFGPGAPEPGAAPRIPPRPAINESTAHTFRANALDMLAIAIAQDFRPLTARLEAALMLPEEKAIAAIAVIRADFPEIARAVLSGRASVGAQERIQGTALIDGAATARQQLNAPAS